MKNNLRYMAFTSALGSALEYYSFIIYILLSAYLGKLFFPAANPKVALLSTLVNYILTRVFTDQEILHFAWRIPFLLAGILGIIGYKIRTRVAETPLFLAQKPDELPRAPIFTVLKEHGLKIIIGMGLVWSGAALVNFGLFIPTFLQTYFGYAARDTYLAMSVGFAIDFLLIIFGIIADRISVKRFYLLGIVINLLALYPIFSLLHTKTLGALYAFNLSFHLLILLLAACYPAMLARLFPTKVRYSGVAFSYLTAYSIAGLIPFLTGWLYINCCGLKGIIGFFMVSFLLSLIAAIFYQNKNLA